MQHHETGKYHGNSAFLVTHFKWIFRLESAADLLFSWTPQHKSLSLKILFLVHWQFLRLAHHSLKHRLSIVYNYCRKTSSWANPCLHRASVMERAFPFCHRQRKRSSHHQEKDLSQKKGQSVLPRHSGTGTNVCECCPKSWQPEICNTTHDGVRQTFSRSSRSGDSPKNTSVAAETVGTRKNRAAQERDLHWWIRFFQRGPWRFPQSER